MPDLDRVLDNMEERKARRENRRGPVIIRRLLIIALLLGALYGFSFTSVFTVDKIDVTGNSYYTDQEIANIAHAEMGVNLFHKTPRSDMKKYLENDPYIIKATVTKIPPGTIRISVTERRQVGAVVYGDEYIIIDKTGLILRRTRTRPKITIITGIQVKDITPGKILGVTDETIFQNALDIINAMEEGQLYFIKLDMSEMYCRAHVYDTLVVVGTADQLVFSIESTRLQKILEELFSRGIKRGTINVTDDGIASYSPTV